jgi:DNA mismatch repair protein MutS
LKPFSVKQDLGERPRADHRMPPADSPAITTSAVRRTENGATDQSLAQSRGLEAVTLAGIPVTPASSGDEPSGLTSSEPGASPESFHSILFERPEDRTEVLLSDAPLFADLNLHQIITGITASKEEYDLKPFFYAPLRSVRAITYRHQIMQDCEDPSLLSALKRFSKAMHTMRELRVQSDKLRNKYQKEAWFLDAVAVYCEAVTSLATDLAVARIKSRGLMAFRKYLSAYVTSDRFLSLLEETKVRKADISSIRYSVIIRDGSFTVRKYQRECDYSAEVERTFERFQLGAVKDYTVRFRDEWPEMNHVEEKILEFVANLNPEIFLRLDNYCVTHDSYLDDTVQAFDREIQFYVAYLEYVSRLTRQGLKVCYPEVSADRKDVFGSEVFDLALAQKLLTEHTPIVCNDFYLTNSERIFVVTGPNQGGKTTFARTFGQLQYLGSLGCLVPGRAARVFLFDRLFTHFQRVEDPEALRGALEDSLIRIHDILAQATPSSVIILNEIFTSTTVRDALFLSEKVLATMIELDLLCVCVTFVDELASLSNKVVSMVATVVPENPALRTYKIVRKPPQGLAWAMSIAEKYRVTYDSLKERLKS